MPFLDFKTLLLVEDDDVTSCRESRMLEKEGYSIITAATGSEAVSIALKEPGIDLILMDIDLGKGIDGTQAAEMILKEKEIPILFLSSHTEKEIVDRTEKITSYGYVVKKSGDTVLLASIRLAFRLHDAYIQNQIKSEKLEAANEDLNSTVEELEATNEEFQATIDELEDTKQNLETLLVEHTLSERRLSESEAAFRTLFEATPAGVAILVDRVFKKVNSAMCAISGYTEDELIGHSTQMLYVNNEEFLRVGNELYDSIEETGLNMLESRFRRKDGTEIFALISMSPLDSADISKGVAVTVQDVTELKLFKEQYSTIIQTAMDGLAIYNIEGEIVDANEAFCKISGYTRDELLNMRIPDIEVIDSEQEIKERIISIVEVGFARFESIHRRKDGQLIHVEVSIKGMKDNTDRFFAFVRDITARKKAEDALNESELFLRKSQEVGKIGSYVLEMADPDISKHVFRSTKTMEEIFGIDEYFPHNGENWLSLIIQRDEVVQYFGQQIDDKSRKFYKEYQITRPSDGEIRWILVIGELEYDDEGAPTRMIGTVQDITDRKVGEQALIQERDFSRDALDSLPGLFYLFNDEGKLLRWNKNFRLVSGYSDQEIAAITPLDFFRGDDRDLIAERIESVFKTGKSFAEANFVSKDGTETPCFFSGKLFHLEGKPCVVGMGIDITERKRALELLKESEERWKFAIEGSGDGLWDWNPLTDKVHYSPQWKSMLGYEEDDIDDDLSEWENRVHPDDLEPVLKKLQDHLNGDTSIYISEYRLRCRDGSYKWILDRGKVITRDPEGRPLRVIGIHTDIHDRKDAEEQLKKAFDEKKSLLQELQHRMKNSLAMIIGIIDLEIERTDNSETKTILNDLMSRIDSLSNLYSLLYQSDTVNEIHLNEYMKLITSSLSGTYVNENINIQIDELYSSMAVNIKKATAWGLILNELLTNALKYAFKGRDAGVIRVILHKNDDDEIELSIADNGSGPPEDFNLDESTGFGLLLVRMLAQQLKGTVTFSSGKENVFTVRAPL